ncbi:hypothetical protein VTI74DRAFT_6143 [Chaetomium olivicolor]
MCRTCRAQEPEKPHCMEPYFSLPLNRGLGDLPWSRRSVGSASGETLAERRMRRIRRMMKKRVGRAQSAKCRVKTASAWERGTGSKGLFGKKQLALVGEAPCTPTKPKLDCMGLSIGESSVAPANPASPVPLHPAPPSLAGARARPGISGHSTSRNPKQSGTGHNGQKAQRPASSVDEDGNATSWVLFDPSLLQAPGCPPWVCFASYQPAADDHGRELWSGGNCPCRSLPQTRPANHILLPSRVTLGCVWQRGNSAVLLVQATSDDKRKRKAAFRRR